MTIHRLLSPDDALEQCPLCHEPLIVDGSCHTCGNISQAAQERRADVQADRDLERSES